MYRKGKPIFTNDPIMQLKLNDMGIKELDPKTNQSVYEERW